MWLSALPQYVSLCPFILVHAQYPLQLVIATTHNLLVYELPTGLVAPEKGKAAALAEKPADLVVSNTIEVPSVIGEGGTFRSIR
jgi:hypothetical protein